MMHDREQCVYLIHEDVCQQIIKRGEQRQRQSVFGYVLHVELLLITGRGSIGRIVWHLDLLKTDFDKNLSQ